MMLCALRVKGVPPISVEEACGSAAETLCTLDRVLACSQASSTPARTADAPGRARRAPDAARPGRRLEEELAQLFCSTWPRKGFELGVPAAAGRACCRSASSRSCATSWPSASQHVRRALTDRTYAEEQNRRLIEEMLLEPERHKWVRVANEDIGEPGCKHWHVRPRWGFIGMLMGWWRVVISSGCPLAT